jgi:hypothetical protein
MTEMPQLNPTNIKGSIREFDRWMAETSTDWPQSLKDAGQRALLTLKSLDQPNAHKSAAFMEASRQDLAAFAAAYAEWKR